jgi:hypothetical protein
VDLVPFVHGDCRDYPTWRNADLGKKPEQTVLDERGRQRLVAALEGCAKETGCRAVRRNGNVYEPAEARLTA